MQTESAHLRFTIYDLRFTIYDLRFEKFGERSSRNCEALAKVVRKIMGRCWFERFASYAKPGRWRPFTIYDLRFVNNAQRSCGNLTNEKVAYDDRLLS